MDQPTEFDQFPPEVADAIDGLLWLGHLQSDVGKWGHTWTLQTLKASEELEASLLAKEYQDTFGQVKATAWAHLAMSIIAVDGQEDFCPSIGPDWKQHARAKFRYMTENWYWPIGEWLFGRYVDLVQRQVRALDAIEDLSSRSLRNSWPTVDSLTEPGDSEATSTVPKSDSSTISPELMKTLADKEEKTS